MKTDPRTKVRQQFATLIVVVLLVVFFQQGIKQGHWKPWITLIATVIGTLGLFKDQVFEYPLRAWMKIGQGLGKVVEPIVLSLIYFLILTPTAFLLGRAGRFRKTFSVGQTSSWAKPESDRPCDFGKQF
ncbi:MAG: hypothetical protein JNL01_00415 [Bdellovibrionales bacterium]|nr:hypothetical protein [Bdellovibrionales bacterium]